MNWSCEAQAARVWVRIMDKSKFRNVMLANQPILCPGGADYLCYPAANFSALEGNIPIFETTCVEMQEAHGNLTPIYTNKIKTKIIIMKKMHKNSNHRFRLTL